MARGRGGGVKARGRKGGGKRSGGGSQMPRQLMESYRHGKVAARIAWHTPGQGRRCYAQATAHGVPKRMRWGMCMNVAKGLGIKQFGPRRGASRWPA